MKLNYDCMRAVLFAIEEHTFINEDLDLSPLFLSDIQKLESLKSFKINDIVYVIDILIDAELIKGNIKYASNAVFNVGISGLTKSGHDFIENIKSDNNWNKVKEIGFKVGALSIDVISKIAVSVITQLINQQITMP